MQKFGYLAGGLMLACAAIGLTGCGGSGSAGAGSKTPLTLSTRHAALDAVVQAWDATSGQDQATTDKTLVAFMKSRPEFEDAGVSDDGCAWGRFTDGRLLILGTNDTTPSTAARAVKLSSGGVRRAAGLPQSGTARLFNSMEPVRPDFVTAVAPQLQAAGYKTLTATGTLSDWSAVQGDGVFMFDAHGGSGHDRAGNAVFSIETADLRSDALEAQYSADLDAVNVTYFAVDIYTDSTFSWSKSRREMHYGIATGFVKPHLQFAPNSFAYSAACYSDNAAWKAALFAAGLSVYAGWTKEVDSAEGSASGQFLADRLLGLNQIAPVSSSPPLPLDWPAVQAQMAATSSPTGPKYDTSSSYVNGVHVISKLIFTQNSGDLAVILPVIESQTQNPADGSVTFTGKFGVTQGSVIIGILPQLVTSWTSTQIVIARPTIGGYAQVKVDKRLSNKVAIDRPFLTPPTIQVAKESMTTFTAGVEAAASGQSYMYHWTTSGAHGTLQGSNGKKGTALDTTDTMVTYVPDGASTGDDKVTVEIFLVAGSEKVDLGPASATVTVIDLLPGQVEVKFNSLTGDNTLSTSTRIMDQVLFQPIPYLMGVYIPVIYESIHANSAAEGFHTYLNYGDAVVKGQVIDLTNPTHLNKYYVEIDLLNPGTGTLVRMLSSSGKFTVVDVGPGFIQFTVEAVMNATDNPNITANISVKGMMGSP